MFIFDGDDGEFIAENYGVSWLIWVHLLIMFLLIFLLYYFTVFVSDESSPEMGQIPAKKTHFEEYMKCQTYITNSSCSSQHIKVREDQIVVNRGDASTSKRVVKGEENQEIEEVKETSTTNYGRSEYFSYNPCYLLELGKRAFLKCLGLDSTNTPHSSISNEKNVQGKSTETDKSQ